MTTTRTRSVLDTIRDEHPSYDPIPAAAARAGLSMETVNAACDRVRNDGYYGPISAADWLEQDGREPAHVSDALKILRAVADEVEDYRATEIRHETEMDEDALICGCEDECQGHEVEHFTVDSTEILRACWPWFWAIYGCGPRSLAT